MVMSAPNGYSYVRPHPHIMNNYMFPYSPHTCTCTCINGRSPNTFGHTPTCTCATNTKHTPSQPTCPQGTSRGTTHVCTPHTHSSTFPNLWSSICMLTQCSGLSMASPFFSSLIFLVPRKDFLLVTFDLVPLYIHTHRRAACTRVWRYGGMGAWKYGSM